MVEEENETLTCSIFNQKDSKVLATSFGKKPEPFYILMDVNSKIVL